jgi:hypothetical protein
MLNGEKYHQRMGSRVVYQLRQHRLQRALETTEALVATEGIEDGERVLRRGQILTVFLVSFFI